MANWKIRLGRGVRSDAPLGVVGRLVGTLFFGFFLAIGGFFVFLIGREAILALETYRWDERRCEVLRSEVVREGGEEPYRAVVAFRTLDGGETRQGDSISRRVARDGSHGDAAERLAPYPLGATVACHASAEGELVLERGPWWMLAVILFPMIFVAIGGIGIVAMWRRAPKDAFGNPEPEVLGDQAGRAGRAALWFGLLFAGIGVVMFWFMGARPILDMLAARGWDREKCVVEHSSIVAHDSDDGTTYRVDILYRWDRGRGIERSSRYSFFGGSSSGRSGKSEIVRAHPVGAEVSCWVDPERANTAVLERGLTSHAWVIVVPIALLAIGAAVAVVGRRRATRRARLREQVLRGGTTLDADDPLLEVLPHFEPTPGPVTLRAQSSRWGRFAALVFMMLFWNGIVAVFVNEAWKSHASGDADWFLTFFLVPFLLVGIGFVAGVVHAFLALRNPRPVLVANTMAPELGKRLELQWRFDGNANRIHHIRVALKGVEQATYQVGTNTRTDQNDFFEEVLVERDTPSGAMDGAAAFRLPDHAMHSFESAHNEIRWELEIHGAVARWPDVKETYPLVVLPAREHGGER